MALSTFDRELVNNREESKMTLKVSEEGTGKGWHMVVFLGMVLETRPQSEPERKWSLWKESMLTSQNELLTSEWVVISGI